MYSFKKWFENYHILKYNLFLLICQTFVWRLTFLKSSSFSALRFIAALWRGHHYYLHTALSPPRFFSWLCSALSFSYAHDLVSVLFFAWLFWRLKRRKKNAYKWRTWVQYHFTFPYFLSKNTFIQKSYFCICKNFHLKVQLLHCRCVGDGGGGGGGIKAYRGNVNLTIFMIPVIQDSLGNSARILSNSS